MGKFSRVLPPRLLETYEEGLQDPKILDMNDDIAAAHAREVDLMKRVDKGESGALWEQLYQLKREYIVSGKDPAVLEQLLSTINKGRNDSRAWAEIMQWQKHKQSMVETQARLIVQMNQVVSLASVLGIIAKIGLLFERYVPDKALRASMSKEIDNLIDIKPLSDKIPVLLEDPKDGRSLRPQGSTLLNED